MVYTTASGIFKDSAVFHFPAVIYRPMFPRLYAETIDKFHSTRLINAEVGDGIWNQFAGFLITTAVCIMQRLMLSVEEQATYLGVGEY
jgi:hypothetical protein